MKKIIYLLPLLFLTACGTTAKFVYPSKMSNLVQLDTKPVFQETVAVLPFDDFRNDENSAAPINLYLVPLFPYGYCEYSRPDAARMFVSITEFECDVNEDLSKAFATSLRRSNLFKNAYFTFGGEKDNANFNITGKINEMYYKGRVFSYGLSIAAPYLWFFGAPAGTSLNKINLTLTLKEKNSDNILWEYTINKEDYYTQWIYYRFGWDVKLFATLLEQGYNEAILDLQKQIRNNPGKFGLK